MIDREDQEHVFRLRKERVYYISTEVLKLAQHFGRDEIASAGVCFGKFTKTKKFRLHVTCLDLIAKYA